MVDQLDHTNDELGTIKGAITEGTTPKLAEKPVPIVKDRITVVESLYYQPFGGNPSVIDCRYDRWLDCVDEQPYSRKSKVGEEWIPLDIGWITACGLLHIENNEGKFPFRIPTAEEKAESNAKVLEINYAGSERCLLVPPGESTRIIPSHPKDLLIRCRKGQAKFTVTAFPS